MFHSTVMHIIQDDFSLKCLKHEVTAADQPAGTIF